MSERNDRKVYVGKVVSDKMDKTITVLVETYKTHKLYGKRVKYSKKYKTHDENNSAKLGDIVKIQETRPLSGLTNDPTRNTLESSRQLWCS
ncbi:MAG: 30S ribosomal protein S17 [Staphylococcus aureus]|nr:30S ribosomal protein S17 [Staphylococcus aureus]